MAPPHEASSEERRGRPTLAISAGVGAGHFVALLAAPVLTRIYSPDDFGLFTFFSAAVAVLAVVGTLRLEAAVPLAPTEQEAHRLIRTGLLSLASTAATVAALALLAGALELDLPGPLSTGSALLLAPGLVAFGAYELLSQHAIRLKRYRLVASRSFVQNVAIAGGQLGLGAMKLPMGLIIGQVLGKAVAASFLAGTMHRSASEPSVVTLTPSQVLRKYRTFPALVMPASLANILATQAPYFLVGILYGNPALGFLGLLQKLVAAPQALVAQAFGQVYLAEAAETARLGVGAPQRHLRRTTRRLAVFVVPLCLGLLLAPPSLYALVFGADWAGTAPYAQAMAVAAGAQFLVSPISQTLIIFGRQRAQLVWDVSRLVVITGSVATVFALGAGPLLATWTFAVVTLVFYVILWMMADRTARQWEVGAS